MSEFPGYNQLLVNCNDIDHAQLDGIKAVAQKAGIEAVRCENVRSATVQTDYNSITRLQDAAKAAPISIGPDGALSVDKRAYNAVLREVNTELKDALAQSGLQQAVTDATLNLSQGKPANVKLEALRR